METQDRAQSTECFTLASTREPPRRASLTVAGAKMSVLLFDEPGEGLSVLVENPPPLWVNDIGVLQTADTTMKVRVVYVVRIEIEDDAEVENLPVFRLGLAADVAAPPTFASDDHDDEPPRPETKRVLWSVLTSLVPLECSGSIRKVGLALLLMAVPLVLAGVAWKQWRSAPAGALETVKARPSLDELRTRLRTLGGVEPLLLPEVVVRLKLTDAQTLAFRRLHETTQEALRQMDKFWLGDSRAEHDRKQQMILDTARQEALTCLTEAQLVAWKGLVQ